MKYHTVHVDGVYEHYKNKKRYVVLEVVEHTEREGEYLVTYFCLDDIGKHGSKKVWARPKDMFEEGLEIDGEIVPRFKLLTN
ncbi:hypothetical protein M948_18150 [Virgibacillus sp. CM-4]|uniref:DUF1653 domain-containing protein n=1 Tax=Virgibacillus sp. CM-4 TaxID=1354277 RepID=UPI000388225A|nr:DUF1653 domain-containing protein [Virgibacillus sp. CM-4]EQB35028.1 hypothetical protein M948_18150 [Virgibacillus sp. CM-4]